MEEKRIIEIENILMEAHFQFAMKCLYRFMMIMPKNDIAFSPNSIYEGLLTVYFMSSGDLEERLKQILFLSDVLKYDLIEYYSSKGDSELKSENNASAASSDYDDESRCWIKITKFHHLLPLQNILNNGLEVFDSDNTLIEETNRINTAIKSATENCIRLPVKLGEFRDSMELVLMTVSRLNAQQFQISNLEFDASNFPILHDKRKRRSFFSHEFNMYVSEFLYTNEKTSLFVFLPKMTTAYSSTRRFIAKGVCDLIERLSTEEAISTLRNLLDSDTEDVDFIDPIDPIDPIFELEKEMPMLALLQALGIEDLVKSDAIKLDSFFENHDDSIHLGTVVHRSHVKVTKEDTVAGGVNVIYTGNEIPPPGHEICYQENLGVLLPFVWLIYDKQRRNVLFAGAFDAFNIDDDTPSPIPLNIS